MNADLNTRGSAPKKIWGSPLRSRHQIAIKSFRALLHSRARAIAVQPGLSVTSHPMRAGPYAHAIGRLSTSIPNAGRGFIGIDDLQ
jgi:hypothetical protein